MGGIGEASGFQTCGGARVGAGKMEIIASGCFRVQLQDGGMGVVLSSVENRALRGGNRSG